MTNVATHDIQALVKVPFDPEPSVSGEGSKSVPDTKKVDAKTRLVIESLQHPKYTWRYIGGLKKIRD